MADNKVFPKTSTSSLPIAGETTPTPADYSQEDQPQLESNPAMKGYYESIANKNKAITVLIYLGLTVLGLSLGLIGYFLTTIREPIIRLEVKVDNLKEQTKTNSDAIDGLKQYIYSHQSQSLQTPQK